LAGGATPGDTAGFPVTLDTAGTYVLTGPLTVSDANTSAISVTADNVTIDLNGFKVAGPGSCSGWPVTSCTPGGSGVGITSSGEATTVRDGIVRGFAANGVNLATANGNGRVQNVTAFHNGSTGIAVQENSTVQGCQAVQNGNHGITGTGGVAVEHNQVHGNACIGISVSVSGTVRGNVVRGNGCDGIRVDSSTVENNSLYDNRNDGIETTGASLVRGNSVRDSAAYGMRLDSHTGYSHNGFFSNTTAAVTGGVNLGFNNCDGSLCP
jgi:parallel beta-helix repeat protein